MLPIAPDKISHQIIGASIEVHRTLGGPGLLESIYEAALCHELILRGLRVHRQRPVQVVYKGIAIREPLFIENHKWHPVDFFVP